MRFDIHVHLDSLEAPSLDRILAEIRGIQRSISDLKGNIMSALTDLQAAVTAEDTAIASAITLLTGLKAALDAAIASGDPAALTALSTDIGNQTSTLAAAVAANTPAAPAAA